jgi:DNA polymerase I
MKPLKLWETRLENVRAEPARTQINYGLKKSPGYYTEKINFVDSVDKAEAMLELAQQRHLSHVGFDTEFRFDRPGVIIDKRNTKYDPFSIRPQLFSLAMVEPLNDGSGRIFVFVVDLRKPELLPILEQLFKLPIPFVGHYAKVELFCLFKLGIKEPNILWDTFIFEKALHLGRHHYKYRLKKNSDDAEEIQIKEEKEETESFSNSLIATCQRYGVKHGMETQKSRLQQSFLDHSDDAPFSSEQIEYAAEDAIATAQLYPPQTQKAVQQGLLQHCVTVEMPWVVTNARIEWNGARMDINKRDHVVHKVSEFKRRLEGELSEKFGIANVNSHKQLTDFFKMTGILEKFRRGQKVSFDKKLLKENEELHPVIPLIRIARKASDILSDKIFSPEFISEDGRIRAAHNQLGTETGRQTSRFPNVLGLDKMLRSLLIPDPGNGIGENDYSQVEVGVSAAVYGDEKFIQMFNAGDVYSAMARQFHKSDLTAADRDLSDQDFKVKYKDLRDQMKSCTLGMIYGITPIGLAKSLGVPEYKAKELQERFMSMFPTLRDALDYTVKNSAIRGYANTITGLKRHRGKSGRADNWERNWLKNHPVQGSAAAVFKAAGNRLDKLYQAYDAKIIIPLHDSFIFEAPLEKLEEVAELTEKVMCYTLQEYFPELNPRVEINISRPECWNKDGDAESLERWIEEQTGIVNTLP